MGFRKTSGRRTLDCIILAGQSNCEGGDSSGTPSSTYLGQQKTYIWFKPNDYSSTDNGRIMRLYYGVNQNFRTSLSLDKEGPEFGLGYQYYQQTGKELVIIKYGWGGSSLVDDGSFADTSGLWQWNANATRASNLLHYSNLINNFVIPCYNQCKWNGIDLNIKAIHWMQGEADATSSTQSALYETRLIATFDHLLTDLASYGLSPNFKPIISRIYNYDVSARPYKDTIRTAHVNVANHYSGYWIDTDSYTLAADNVHFTKAQQEQHGIDVCNKLLLIS